MCQVSPDMLANMINQWVAKEKKNALGAGYVLVHKLSPNYVPDTGNSIHLHIPDCSFCRYCG
jgi:hypothetical protein